MGFKNIESIKNLNRKVPGKITHKSQHIYQRDFCAKIQLNKRRENWEWNISQNLYDLYVIKNNNF